MAQCHNHARGHDSAHGYQASARYRQNRSAWGIVNHGVVFSPRRERDNRYRQHGMRRQIQPCGTLRSGCQQTGFRENLREGQCVRNSDQRREQIAARQHIERARAPYRVLAEQQRRRNEVADQHQGLR